MLAPGSSVSYCVALAGKRLSKWLWTTEEGGCEGTGCVSHLPVGRGYTNNSACFLTHVHANLFPARPHSLLSALSHTLWQSIFLSPLSPVFSLPPLSPFTSSKLPPLCLPLLCCAISMPLVLCLRPLIRFGLGAISFGPVCAGALPCLAEYPGKALRLYSCSYNHVSRA